MSDKFLGSGGNASSNLTNGTVAFYGSSIGAQSLDPSQPVKTNSLRQLVSTKLNISDVNNLQTTLDNALTTPYNGTITATDFETEDYFSVNAELSKIDNITSATQAPNVTNVSGLVKVDEIAVDKIYSPTQSIWIDLNTTDVDISATNLRFNTNPVVSTPYSSTIQASGFVKTGGNDKQYLMADGSVLASSANSGNSNFYLYNNTNSSTDTTPVDGEVIINNDTNNTLATIVYVSHLTRDNIDVEVFWQFVNQLTDLYIQDQNSSSNFVRYNITALPTITLNNKLAIPVVYVTGNGTGNSTFGVGHNIMISFFTNTLETDTRITALETKTTNQTFASGTGTTSWTGVGSFASLNSPIMDSATTIALGTNTQTALTIGRSASATNIRGSTLSTTGNILPSVTNVNSIGSSTLLYSVISASTIGANAYEVPVTSTAMTIGGAASCTSVTMGRVGANTTVKGLITVITGVTCLNIFPVPYINAGASAPIDANPRLVLAKCIMPVNNTVREGAVILNTVSGVMGGLSSLANEPLVGTSWRYKFNGYAVNASSTNTLTFQIIHAGGTQNIATWTYGVSTPANANFNGEIVLFFTQIGAVVSPQVSGYINFVGGASVSLQNVYNLNFSPAYNTTVNNANSIQIVASPFTGFQYTVSNFACDQLR